MVASVAVFILVVYATKSNIGVLIGALAGGATGSTAWWLMNSGESKDRLEKVLVNLPSLGAIPTDRSTPSPALGSGDNAVAYLEVVRALEAQTTGNIFLFTSPSPGQGATTVALNVAIAATRAGRRVMLVDGDATGHGLSRFLSTGSTPGLTELALGETTLTQASRLLVLGPKSKLPVLPSGGGSVDSQTLSGVAVADALDAVATRADLIIIDAPPVGWSDVTPHLAAHADGSILVVSDVADASVVADAGGKLAQVGAPVAGYVTNRAERAITPFAAVWKPFTARFVLSSLILAVAFSVFTGAQLWNSWANIEREDFSLSEANDLLATTTTTLAPTVAGATVPETTTTTTEAPQMEPYDTFLIIGGDDDSGASDVILYLVMPTNGAEPFMVSFPRDLYVDNPCTGGQSRINALSHGCRDKGINGPTLLSVQISEMTGINVDHFAEFTFDGFVEIIDSVGGVEVCVGDYKVRDAGEAQLSLPAGCTDATGTQALSWVRSRKTQQFRDGEWRRMPGTSDLMRNEHQQDVIVALAGQLKEFESPQQLTQIVASVADAFTLSDTLSLTDAISLAWSLRGIDIATINRLEIPVELGRSPSNQSILRATADIKDVIVEVYGNSLPPDTGA